MLKNHAMFFIIFTLSYTHFIHTSTFSLKPTPAESEAIRRRKEAAKAKTAANKPREKAPLEKKIIANDNQTNELPIIIENNNENAEMTEIREDCARAMRTLDSWDQRNEFMLPKNRPTNQADMTTEPNDNVIELCRDLSRSYKKLAILTLSCGVAGFFLIKLLDKLLIGNIKKTPTRPVFSYQK